MRASLGPTRWAHGGGNGAISASVTSHQVTSRPMTRLNLPELRLNSTTHLLSQRAAGAEVASGRRVGRAWKIAAEDDALPLPLKRRIGDRDCRQQCPGIGVKRVFVELRTRRELHQLAEIHY